MFFLCFHIWNVFWDLVVLSKFPYNIPDELLVFIGYVMLIREQYFAVIICWTGLTSASDLRLLLTMYLLNTVASNTLIGICTNHLPNDLTLAPLVLPFIQVHALNHGPSGLLSSWCKGYLADGEGFWPLSANIYCLCPLPWLPCCAARWPAWNCRLLHMSQSYDANIKCTLGNMEWLPSGLVCLFCQVMHICSVNQILGGSNPNLLGNHARSVFSHLELCVVIMFFSFTTETSESTGRQF